MFDSKHSLHLRNSRAFLSFFPVFWYGIIAYICLYMDIFISLVTIALWWLYLVDIIHDRHSCCWIVDEVERSISFDEILMKFVGHNLS